MRWLAVAAICFFLTLPGISQKLPFRTFTVKDGLMTPLIYSMMRDNKGILWIGTSFGINWFDGNRFTEPDILGLNGNLPVISLYEDSEKSVWITTFFNGLFKYQHGKFKQILCDTAVRVAGCNSVLDIKEYQPGLYLLSTDHNVFWFDGKTFRLFDPLNPQLRCQVEKSYILSPDKILFKTHYGNQLYTKSDGIWKLSKKIFKSLSIADVVQNNGAIFMMHSKGLFRYRNVEAFINEEKPELLIADNISSISFINHSNDEFWASGSRLYKIKGNTVSDSYSQKGLTSNPIKVLNDKENILWIQVPEGLTRLSDEKYELESVNEILQSSPTTISGAGNDIWIGGFDGIVKISGNVQTRIKKVEGRYLGNVGAMSAKSGYPLYFSSAAGFVKATQESVKIISRIPITKWVEWRDGSLIAGDINGKVYRIKNDTIYPLKMEAYGDYIDGMVYINNFLWIGHRASGIRKYEITGDTLLPRGEITSKTGNGDVRVRFMTSDSRGNIVFGTRNNGLGIIESGNTGRVRIINNKQGLMGNWVRTIYSHNQKLYVGTDRGLNIVDENYDSVFIRYLNFNNEFGSEGANSVYRQGDKFLIATNIGIIHYYLEKDNVEEQHRKVFITEFSVNGKIDTTLIPYSPQFKPKKLSTGENIISLSFSTVNLKDDQPSLYRYKLIGQNDDWSKPDYRNFVTYNLLPGKYEFLVQSQSPDGSWGDSAASVSFYIPQPFYFSMWFIMLILFSAGAVIVLIYRYRLRQALKLERLRSRISTDLHDDIGSTLSSISILSEMALNGQSRKDSREMIEEIKTNSLSLMEKMDDIVWSINPRNDSLEQLLIRIRSFASRLFEARNIEYMIDIDETVKNAKLPMEYRQHIYLTLKESINNIIKYASCSRASISVKFINNVLTIVIADNGKGFNTSEVKNGNGIDNIRFRAKQVRAKVNIESSPNSGTIITWAGKIK